MRDVLLIAAISAFLCAFIDSCLGFDKLKKRPNLIPMGLLCLTLSGMV